MLATELRIGNLVNRSNVLNNDESYRVFSIRTLPIGKRNGDKFKPIPLTEEWLVKFGFVNSSAGMGGVHWGLKTFHLTINDGGNVFKLDHVSFDKELPYVHQLQNLYHSLTGEELIIKE